MCGSFITLKYVEQLNVTDFVSRRHINIFKYIMLFDNHDWKFKKWIYIDFLGQLKGFKIK